MSQVRTPLRSVAVVGGGPVAAATALALAGGVPGLSVTLVPAPVAPAALADHWPLLLASAHPTLLRLGAEPAGLIAGGIARRRTATRFADWGVRNTAWRLGDGRTVPLDLPAEQLWVRGTRAGPMPPFHTLVPAAMLPERRAHDDLVDPALWLRPDVWTARLAGTMRAAAVRVSPAPLANVRHAAGSVAGLVLANGMAVAADLYVDATGPDRRLAVAGHHWQPWADVSPVDRLLACPDPYAAPFDGYRAVEDGWLGWWPGWRGFGYRAALTSETRARQLLEATAPAIGPIELVPGRVDALWSGNVLAVGDAAAMPGPLGHFGLTLAFQTIELVLELLPSAAPEPLLQAELNRRFALRADRLRDFVGALHRANGRRHGRFWRSVASAPLPFTLRQTMDHQARRGYLPHFDEDMMAPDAWHSVLLGQECLPEGDAMPVLHVQPDEARSRVLALTGTGPSAAVGAGGAR